MTQTKALAFVDLDDSDLTLAEVRDDLRGMTVVDLCHHRVGEVDGLIIDEEHRRARLLVVASGGILDLPRIRSLVPVDAVSRVDEFVHIEASHPEVHDATYDPGHAPSPAYEQVYRHYGYLPVSAPGYHDPDFLRRERGA